MLQEIKDEAVRQDRSLSWIMQRAWKIARAEIKAIPGPDEQLSDTQVEPGPTPDS